MATLSLMNRVEALERQDSKTLVSVVIDCKHCGQIIAMDDTTPCGAHPPPPDAETVIRVRFVGVSRA